MESEYFDWVADFELPVKLAKTSTPTRWQMGRITKVKVRVHEDYEYGTIREATGVCSAIQIEGPSPGQEAIAKVKLQLSPWDDPTVDAISMEAIREMDNLAKLTDVHCSSTPAFIGRAHCVQGDDLYIPGGYIVFILMERLPGRDLGCFHELSLEERDEVRIAFLKALWEFHRHGFDHWDPRRENIMWDNAARKCYILDLEDAEDLEIKGMGTDPLYELSAWDLHGKASRPAYDHVDDDPMIPPERKGGWTFYDREEMLAMLMRRVTQ
ncbi:uncharacterized protein BO80DRAFT_462886 [Aspergillus ibericus CBS 121593]|uniref:Protein kinase domain-containing protein n=1 Tax=Aspergillus ibericus CBS 121593 TaxID=1448316 RepID=A0A395H5J4_9EURO|nr:hypothetical protein BO80DRAFT_462886 [Aspergillus ibericus CBS 121593]RAL03147.1 hypothetical protein BO80DRAFT_462886 [Aspergillus ibericus CBS 121593]